MVPPEIGHGQTEPQVCQTQPQVSRIGIYSTLPGEGYATNNARHNSQTTSVCNTVP